MRRGVLELYVSEHPMGTCDDASRCELETLAAAHGIAESRFAGPKTARHVHTHKPVDISNPYFRFDNDSCIVCSRCVRACEETQGTYALTVEGRGLESRIVASQDDPFLESECVSCGACVEACPTGALMEKSLITAGLPQQAVPTTCAYCGVGCSLVAEVTDGAVSRMVPNRDGRANQGHACVKGRFAYGYATHQDRVTKPLIRKSITDEWREVSWDEAINYAASEFKRIQAKHGRDSIGGITSSRCTNEETFLVQKLVRAAFGTNNVDTCARVCHSPTGYGLKHTLGESAGTQEFVSVQHADVIMVIGASPTEAHPVFASQMKRRLRAGAQAHRRRSARHPAGEVRACRSRLSPAPAARHECGRHQRAGARGGDRGPDEGRSTSPSAARRNPGRSGRSSCPIPSNSPEAMEKVTGVPAKLLRGAARLYASGPNSAIYYGLGVTEHSQGTTMVMGIANLAMATGNLGREGVGVSPLRGQNNVQGSCDMGSFPHEFPRLSARVGRRDARAVRVDVEGAARQRARACAFPTCSRRRSMAPSAVSISRAKTSRSRIRTPRMSPRRCPPWNASSSRTSSTTRRPGMRMCSCPDPRSSRRTAPSPTPNGAFRACAR